MQIETKQIFWIQKYKKQLEVINSNNANNNNFK